MAKVIRLTESDLYRIVKRVISEQEEQSNDVNNISKGYDEFLKLLPQQVATLFQQQFDKNSAISYLTACTKPKSYGNLKEMYELVKNLASKVTGNNLKEKIQSIGNLLVQKNVNEQTFLLGGAAVLLLIFLFREFLFVFDYFNPTMKSCGESFLGGALKFIGDMLHLDFSHFRSKKFKPTKPELSTDTQSHIWNVPVYPGQTAQIVK